MEFDDHTLAVTANVNVCCVSLTEYDALRYRRAIPGMERLAQEIEGSEYFQLTPDQVSDLLDLSGRSFDFHLQEYANWDKRSGKGRPLGLRPSSIPDPIYADGRYFDYRDKFFEKEFGVHQGGAVGSKYILHVDKKSGRKTPQFYPSWFVAPWFRYVKMWWEGNFDNPEAYNSGGRKTPADGRVERDFNLWTGPKGGWRPVLNQPLKLAFLTLPNDVGATLDNVHALFKDQKGRGRPIDGRPIGMNQDL